MSTEFVVLPSTPPDTNEKEIAEPSPSASFDGLRLPDDGPCGLTPASLKHLRRQKENLLEDKIRLQAEIESLRSQLRDQKDRVSALEAEAQELRNEAQAAREQAKGLEVTNSKLEESLAHREAEVARLREALDDALRRAEAQSQGASSSELTAANLRVRQLEVEKQALLQELSKKNGEQDDMRVAVLAAMAASEKAMAMHSANLQIIEQMRAAKLSEAINNKVELHISVPRVSLSYNHAPPLMISTASAFGETQIRDFLAKEVFPHFEPLWVTMDGLDKAPDGSCKRTYSTKMLDRLADAVKAFVVRSQTADNLAEDAPKG